MPKKPDFTTVRKGDSVTRMLGGVVPMLLKVTELTDDQIICGAWTFDRTTGVEIDDDISVQVSHLTKIRRAN